MDERGVQDRPGSGAARGRRETFAGALVVALFALFFLRRPIAEVGDGVYGPHDFSQSFALTRVDDGAEPANPALQHAWATHQTWLALSARHVAGGELPTWNGFNGGGIPHLANPHTAVFSPFSWSFHVFDLAWASLVAAFAKLFVVGFATFLFLREVRIAFAGALVGALVFMFSGAEITTLLLPQSSTVILLPFGLFLAERFARIVEASLEARPRGPVSGTRLVRVSIAFALVIAASFFGGALDTFLFCAAVVAAWIVARLSAIARRGAFDLPTRREIGFAALHLAGIAVAASLVCAIQALPYLEYAGNARVAPLVSSDYALPSWPLLLFPNLFGNPASANWFGPGFHAPDFMTFAAVASGALPIMLAVFGFSATRREQMGWFFAAVAIAGFCAGTGLLGHGLFQGLFPLQGEPEIQRAVVLFPFAIAVLAALAIDRVAAGGPVTGPFGALCTFAAAAAVVLFARGMAQRTLETALDDPRLVGDRVWHAVASSAHMDFVVGTFLLGIGLFALATTMRRGRPRALCLLAIAPVAYAQVGSVLEDFNPVTPDRYVLPRTDGVDRRDGTVGMRSSVVLGDVDVPPSVNALYGLRSLGVNDPFHVRRFDQLHEAMFVPRGEYGVVTRTTRHALEVFGVECVFAANGWPSVDTEFDGAPPPAGAQRETEALGPNSGVSQYFTPPADGIRALRFPWITSGVPNAHEYGVTVDDLDTGERLVGLVVTPWSVRPAGRAIVDCIVPFPRDAKVQGHALLLRVTSSSEARAGVSYAIGCRTDRYDLPSTWRATQGERVLEGQVDLDLSYGFDALRKVDRVGPFSLFQLEDASPRFRTVGSARVVADDGASWQSVLDPAFDARREVILESAPGELACRGSIADEAGAKVEVLDDLDGHARLIVKRKTAGFVVTPIAWYPGWRVKVNAAETRPLCANYAFTAVAVPAGESLVEFEYAPKSVRKGSILSIVGLLSLLVAFAFTVQPERRA